MQAQTARSRGSTIFAIGVGSYNNQQVYTIIMTVLHMHQ